jgi:nanoRNase/pAp phosphatase (c-di-AMP/oligoRNAs hydrolase)
MAVFDRTWYGRVLVERIEKYASKNEWRRAYEEINQFEKQLADDGCPVIKIFLHITKKEQLRRFEEREKNPYKNWKIGPDDWRVSMRSKGAVDINAVAKEYGGGGHKNASGCSATGALAELTRVFEQKILAQIYKAAS